MPSSITDGSASVHSTYFIMINVSVPDPDDFLQQLQETLLGNVKASFAEHLQQQDTHSHHTHHSWHTSVHHAATRTMPKMEPVQSTCLRAAGYDAASRRLYLEFVSNWKTYTFYRVPVEVYGRLMAAPSKGTFYRDHIKGRYTTP